MHSDRSSSIDLWLFTTDAGWVRRALAARISTFVVDWEWRAKEDRQRNADTEINHDTPEDLARVAAVPGAKALCRLNAFGPDTDGEIETAIEAGAWGLMLPMVESPGDVERFLRRVDGRCRAGILVETQAACLCASDLATLPLDLVYMGLNDLAISRGTPSIFAAVSDGTVEQVREQFPTVPFGFGGLTVVDKGHPIPCIRLLEEMARLGCAFSFLRRSFYRDIDGRDLSAESKRLRARWRTLRARTPDRERADRERLIAAIERAYPICR